MSLESVKDWFAIWFLSSNNVIQTMIQLQWPWYVYASWIVNCVLHKALKTELEQTEKKDLHVCAIVLFIHIFKKNNTS